MKERILSRIKRIWRRMPLGHLRKSTNPVRWGIIGLGYMAETFACAIDGNGNGVVYAAASRSLDKAKKFAVRHGHHVKAYGSYEEMVYDKSLKLDVVYVATPVKCHFDNVKLCLEAGLNVLCEKPVTSTRKQFEELIGVAKRNGCFLMEGMWMKCLPAFRQACQWIRDGKIGHLELIRADFYKREHIRDGYAIYNKGDGGGVLRDFGVYAIAFAEHFLGGVPDALHEVHRISPYGIDSDWQITLEKNGVNAVVSLSSDFGSLSKAVVVGNSGFIEWESQFNRTNRVSLYNDAGELQETFSVSYIYDGFEYEIDEVQRCILAGLKESSCVPLEASLNTMTVIDSLKKE